MCLAHHVLHVDVHSFNQLVSFAVDFVLRVDDANERIGRNAKGERVVLARARATKADDLEHFFQASAQYSVALWSRRAAVSQPARGE